MVSRDCVLEMIPRKDDNMNYTIRPETKQDYKRLRAVIKSAFYREGKDDDFNEWILVEKIRESDFYINALSLVAEIEDEIVGYIMFTPMKIVDGADTYDSLALAPVAVEKAFQNKGIGTGLVEAGIETARQLGYRSIIVMGHPTYYTKFGFEKASKWRIGLDENYDSDYLFALELTEKGLEGVHGIVKYCAPFYSEDGELI